MKKIISLILISFLALTSFGLSFAMDAKGQNELPTNFGVIDLDELEEELMNDRFTFEELAEKDGSIIISANEINKELKKKSDYELSKLGLTTKEIDELRSSSIEPLSAQVALNISAFNYQTSGTYGSGETSVYLKLTWAWDSHVPGYTSYYPDIVALTWGRGLTSDDRNSNTSVHVYEGGQWLDHYWVNDFDDISPNAGGSYRLETPDSSYHYTTGTSTIRLYDNDSAITHFEARGAYGLNTLSFSPEVSFPGGVQIDFSSGISEEAVAFDTFNVND